KDSKRFKGFVLGQFLYALNPLGKFLSPWSLQLRGKKSSRQGSHAEPADCGQIRPTFSELIPHP
ncbi:MAG: hypothetical protein ACYDC1_22430, partial [Limisphaerales bacterium]